MKTQAEQPIHHATPLTAGQRKRNYGRTVPTDRQWRRINHKRRHALAKLRSGETA